MIAGIFIWSAAGVKAQDDSKNVHLKVVKNGEITIDTVFLAADLDDEALQEKISELTGGDFKMKHNHDSDGDYSYAYLKVDNDEDGDGKEVMKKKIIITEKADDQEKEKHVYILTGDEESIEAQDGKVIIVDSDGGKNVWVTKEKDEEGTEIKIIKVKKEKNGEKEITVKVITDDEVLSDNDENEDIVVYIVDGKDGTEIVNKKVERIEKIEEGGETIEITVVVSEEKEKTGEMKQKKEKKRKKK